MLIEKPNPTDSQKSASRTNGARGHGPTTPAGKHKSARNSFRHGLLAKTIVFENESREQFAALVRAFIDELQPQTPIEDLLVQKMAVNHWRQERIWSQQKARNAQEAGAANWQPTNSQPTHPNTTDKPADTQALQMNVTEMRYDRQFGRALDRLLQYRAQRENASREAQRENASREAQRENASREAERENASREASELSPKT